MDLLFLFIVFLGAAIVGPRFVPRERPYSAGARRIVQVAFGFLALACVASTSFVMIPANQVGIVRKLYAGGVMPDGHLIATRGETGYQASILAPGTFKISPFYRVLNEVDEMPIVTIPNGFYGRLVTTDGAPLRDGQIMADAWPEADLQHYLDAEYFLTHGGQKGLQSSILKPGRYPLNLQLYQVRIGYRVNGQDSTGARDDIYDGTGYRSDQSPFDTSITRVPAGFVGVVRSTISLPGLDCRPIRANTEADGLVAQLVPRGCTGIWNTVLSPGDYYLLRDAYDLTLVDTRVQALDFRGGYSRRYIDLSVDQQGSIVQQARTQQFPFDPNTSADAAVNIKVEGWEVPQEVRVVLQVRPENAPVIVAAVGALAEIERRIIVPSIRSALRNVGGGTIAVTTRDAAGAASTVVRQTQVLDLVEQRPAIEAAVLALASQDGRRAGVDVKEIRLGESAIPPEILVARLREQLADQLAKAFEQERMAQEKRQETEQARATADQQPELVRAQIGVQVARQTEERRAAEGRAERRFLEEQAAGQRAQADVLGQSNVIRLQVVHELIDAVRQRPEILTGLRLPATMVLGGGGLEGAMAVLKNAIGTGAAAPAP